MKRQHDISKDAKNLWDALNLEMSAYSALPKVPFNPKKVLARDEDGNEYRFWDIVRMLAR